MFGIAIDYVTLGMGPISIQFFDGGTPLGTEINDLVITRKGGFPGFLLYMSELLR
jgi:hypothetical protein